MPARSPETVRSALLCAAFEQSPVPMILRGADCRLDGMNAAFLAMIGAEPGTALEALPLAELTLPEDAEWMAWYQKRLLDGDIAEYRAPRTYRRVDGTLVTCQLTAVPVRVGGVVAGILGVAEPHGAAPIDTDRRWRKLLEHLNDTIIVTDAQGHLLEWAGHELVRTQWPRSFWDTHTVIDVIHHDDLPKEAHLEAQLLAAPGRSVTGEFRLVDEDGTIEHVEVFAVNLLDDADVRGIVMTMRSITERVAIMAELAASRDEADARAAMRSRLVATVSHELRNPLHAMSGIAELLATSDLPGDAHLLAATLHDQMRSMAHVIDDLLEDSRLTLGAVELQDIPTDLVALVDEVVVLGRSAAQGRPVEVVARVLDEVPPVVSIDRERLRQVLANLVVNAVKFTDQGTVEVRACVPDERVLCLAVEDTGRGIPADELDEVFGAFITASTGGTRRGAGLGLSIVRQLVELMGGTVDVASTVGEGSTFRVQVPLVRATGVPAPEVTVACPPASPVLVVEDNPVNQLLTTRQLERLGMTPVVVGSGEEALDLLAAGRGPFMVLMDRQLPGMDGVECTRRVRQLDGRHGTRTVVIGMTALVSTADRAVCADAGMDDFLAKPVGLSDLAATLSRWCVTATPPPGSPPGAAQPAPPPPTAWCRR